MAWPSSQDNPQLLPGVPRVIMGGWCPSWSLRGSWNDWRRCDVHPHKCVAKFCPKGIKYKWYFLPHPDIAPDREDSSHILLLKTVVHWDGLSRPHRFVSGGWNSLLILILCVHTCVCRLCWNSKSSMALFVQCTIHICSGTMTYFQGLWSKLRYTYICLITNDNKMCFYYISDS